MDQFRQISKKSWLTIKKYTAGEEDDDEVELVPRVLRHQVVGTLSRDDGQTGALLHAPEEAGR